MTIAIDHLRWLLHYLWTKNHTLAVQKIKGKVKNLPCLALANPDWFKIVQTDASNIGYGGILTQVNPTENQPILVRYVSGKWSESQCNYATVKKELLAIVKYVSKFKDDLLNQKFLLKIDCQAAKYIFSKDVKHD